MSLLQSIHNTNTFSCCCSWRPRPDQSQSVTRKQRWALALKRGLMFNTNVSYFLRKDINIGMSYQTLYFLNLVLKPLINQTHVYSFALYMNSYFLLAPVPRKEQKYRQIHTWSKIVMSRPKMGYSYIDSSPSQSQASKSLLPAPDSIWQGPAGLFRSDLQFFIETP